MFTIKDSIITIVLEKLNTYGEALIFGGFIRDNLIGIPPKDVDICTNLPEAKVLEVFPFAQKRMSVNGYTIVYFQKNGVFFEIVCNIKDTHEKLKKSDLTANSLAFDGDKIIDLNNGYKDIQNKTFRFTEKGNFITQLKSNPILYVKIFRLVSKTNFDIDEDTLGILLDFPETINEVSNSIKIQELYSIIFSKYNIKALYFMSLLGLVSTFEYNNEYNVSLEYKNKKTHHFILTWMALQTSYETVNDFIELFHCPDTIKDNFHQLYDIFIHNKKTNNFKLLNEKLILERMLKR